MADPLGVNDHWCCHKTCPHVGDGTRCVDCRWEYLESLKENKTGGYDDGLQGPGQPPP